MILKRKVGSPLASIVDGVTLYEGRRESYTDVFLDNAKIYYYGLWAYDRKPNYSEPIFLSSQPVEGLNFYQTKSVKTTISALALTLVKDFEVGDTDEAIQYLQEFLISLGFLPKIHTPTDFFGPVTEKAILEFQKVNGLPETGIVDEATRNALLLKPLLHPSLVALLPTSTTPTATTTIPIIPPALPPQEPTLRTLKRGSEGDDVKYIQEKLQKLGFFSKNIKPNGYFGPATEHALQAFQREYQIVLSGTPLTTGFGLFGPKTKAKLKEITGVEIPQVQKELPPPITPKTPEEKARIETLKKEAEELKKLLESIP